MPRDPRHYKCIFGCDIAGIAIHKFPNPERRPDLFAAWRMFVGDRVENLNDWRVYKTKFICDRHFTPGDRSVRHRLVPTAIPSINRDGMPRSSLTLLQHEHNYSAPTVICSSSEQNINEQAAHPSVALKANPSDAAVVSVEERVPPVPMEHRVPASTSFKPGQLSNAAPESSLPNSNKKIKNLQNEIHRLRALNKCYKEKLIAARKMTKLQSFKKLCHRMSTPAKMFVRLQLEEKTKHPKGRRFTDEEKIIALSLYKNSPKNYKFLGKLMSNVLPSKKTLKKLLSKVSLHPGINEAIFEEIKKSVSDLEDPEDKLVTLIFDEMSLSPQIHYNDKKDKLIGFEDDGEITTPQIVDHVLVVMVKGVKQNFKQPVAYYFHQNMKMPKLKKIIKSVTKRVQETGLEVVAMVCDQSAVNVSTINNFIDETRVAYIKAGKEWRRDVIEMNGKEIIPIYDVPHLLKGLRNNLLNKELKFKDGDGIERKVKWEYFEKIYEADKTQGELRLLFKITEEHINPNKMKKMKVRTAAQVFSRTMASATNSLIKEGEVPEHYRDVIPLVLFIDKLFDSFNAATFHIPNGKLYKGAVKMNSPHHKLWDNAIKILKTFKFYQLNNNNELVEKSVPSVRNFIKTIEGYQAIWQVLRRRSLDSMLTRNFNQDPLENFFGSIRSLGVRNVSPDCVGFEGAFKTLLINNYNSTHSINANCEEDDNVCLKTYGFLLNQNQPHTSEPSQSQHISVTQPLELVASDAEVESTQQASYVCGWVLSKCLQKICKSCKACRSELCGDATAPRNFYIKMKEYNKNKKWLCYPSEKLQKYFVECQNITVSFLKSDCHIPKIKERISCFIDCFTEFNINCETHKLAAKNFITNMTINVLIYSWCRSVNRILAGKIIYDGSDDNVKNSAQKYCNKHKHK